MNLGKSKERYDSGEKNGVISGETQGKPNEPSFAILPVKYECPLLKYYDKDGNPKEIKSSSGSSFIELNDEDKKEGNSFLELLNSD